MKTQEFEMTRFDMLNAMKDVIRHKLHPHRFEQFLINRNAYIAMMHDMTLMSDYFDLGKDRQFTHIEKYTGKHRQVSAPQIFPDQFIHSWLMSKLEQTMLKSRYEHSYCGIAGKGQTAAIRQICKDIKKNKSLKWCLKCDISKFYPSVNKDLLFKKICRKVRNKDLQILIHAIIFNTKSKGLPIGYETSVRFAEILLTSFDHMIKEKLHIKKYYRFADDMILIDTNKRKLKKAKIAIEEALATLQLKLNPKWQIFKIKDRPIDFVGCRIWHDGHHRLRKCIYHAFMRTIIRTKLRKRTTVSQARAYISRFGMFKHCNSKCFYIRRIKPLLSQSLAKRIISQYDIKHQNDFPKICYYMYE